MAGRISVCSRGKSEKLKPPKTRGTGLADGLPTILPNVGPWSIRIRNAGVQGGGYQGTREGYRLAG